MTRLRPLAHAPCLLALLLGLACDEQLPPQTQSDAAAEALLLMLDEAVREVQADSARRADLSEMEHEPDVIYVPTPEAVVDRMLEMADVGPEDVVYDLGCGDGRIVVRAAQLFGVQARGFDIDPERIAEARANVEAAGVEDLVTIEQADIFSLDLSPASVVMLYLLPELNVRLLPQLSELSPGSRIVSHDFGLEGVPPLDHDVVEVDGDSETHEIFLWHTPLPLPDDTKQPESELSEAPSEDDDGAAEASPEAVPEGDAPSPEKPTSESDATDRDAGVFDPPASRTE